MKSSSEKTYLNQVNMVHHPKINNAAPFFKIDSISELSI